MKKREKIIPTSHRYRIFKRLPYEVPGKIKHCLKFIDGRLRKTSSSRVRLVGREFSRLWSTNGNRKPYKLLHLIRFISQRRQREHT